jgi:hypothetical protein
MWSCFRKIGHIAGVAAMFALLSDVASAETTTTEQVGDVGDFLIQRATCKDFSDALGRAKDPDQSTEDILLVLMGIVFIEGYTAGNGTRRDGRASFLLDCFAAPERQFSAPAP